MTCQGNRNNNSLSHTTGIHEWIFIKTISRIVDTDFFHQLDGFRLSIFKVLTLMLLNDFCDLPSNRNDRVQGCHRVLEDRSNFLTTDLFPVSICFIFVQILSFKYCLTARNTTVGFQHTCKSLCKYGLTGTGFPNDRKCFVFVQIDGNSADRLQFSASDGELHFNIGSG